MHVAEVADEAAVGSARQQHRGVARASREFAPASPGCRSSSQRTEVLAVELEMRRVLAREHRIRLRAGGDEDGVRRQLECAARASAVGRRSSRANAQRARCAVVIHVDSTGVRPSANTDAFLERLFDLLVVQRVRRAVDQPAPVGDRHAAPVLQQFDDPRGARSRAAASRALADRARVREKLLGDLALFVVPGRRASRPRRSLAASAS